MAHRKISSASADFIIPAHANNDKGKEVKIKLANTGTYDVYQKDLPANLPSSYNWINSFGLKKRPKDAKDPNKTIDTSDSDPYPATVESYTIELDDSAGKEPVYFDGTRVKNFPAKKTIASNGRAHVVLALGDPPIGWPK